MKKALCALLILLLTTAVPALTESAISMPGELEITEEALLLPEDVSAGPETDGGDILLPEDDAEMPFELADEMPVDVPIDLDISDGGLEANLLIPEPTDDGLASDPAVLVPTEEEACFIHSSRDSDALFAGYANGILHGAGPRRNATAYAREKLNSQEQVIYDALKPLLAQVAEGSRASTKFEVPLSALLGLTRITGQALTGEVLSNPMTDDEMARVAAAWKALYTYTLSNVANALWFDCTYELYWLDRYDNPIRAVKPAVMYRYSAELGDWELYVADGAGVSFRFPVLARYQGDTYTVDPGSIDRAKLARKNAQAIVEQYAGCSDYARLAGYVTAICRLVRYDDEAATPEWQYANPQVQDPWKLISVFDDDSSTNVVCEGYAQAYQYLCELTQFDGDIHCRLVTGNVSGTEHSWNLVRMDDGKNYLVDVSSMDGDWDDTDGDLAHWIGENRGNLFLCGGSGNVSVGYDIVRRDGSEEGRRSYRSETLDIYPDAALALAPKRYTPTGFHKLPDGFHYFDDSGAFVTGEALLDGYGYRFDVDGRLEDSLSGWHTVDGERRFFEADGKLHETHTPIIDAAVPPTCTEPGLTEGSHCAVCETVLTPQEPVEMLGHHWGKASYAWSEDYTSVAARRACLNDPAHVQAETVQTSAEVTKAATCTARGTTTYTASFDNTAFHTRKKAVRNIPATGHRWGRAGYTWAEDYTSVTARRACLNDPAHVQIETVQTSVEVTKAATCTARGTTTYTASFRRTAFRTQKKRVRDIPATGHTPVTDPAVPPTATANGLTEGSHCAVCGKVLVAQKPIPRLDNALILRGNACRLVEVGKPRQIIVALGPVRSYKSSVPSVASVSRKGRVSPRAPGIALITIHLKDDSILLLKLVVRDPHAPKSVRIAQGRRATLKVGETLALKAVLRPAGTRSALRWSSSEPRIASVSRSGVVQARQPGRATIVVRTANGKRAAISIAVVR
ncbi:MAG: Ig-like domain-containing protein [Clostridia bacterium]|nr:Ig-like domain-containing protein [Clostridia bacterium]